MVLQCGVGVNKNVGVGKVVLGDFYLLTSTSKSYKKEFIGFGILFYNLDNLIYMVLKHHGNQSKPIFKFHSGYITTKLRSYYRHLQLSLNSTLVILLHIWR